MASFDLTGNPLDVILDDFDRDGIPDLLVLEDTGRVELLAGLGQGSYAMPRLAALFDPTRTRPPSGSAILAFKLLGGDLNLDGRPDFVLVSHGAYDTYVSDPADAGTFNPVQTAYAAMYYSACLLDLNGDGALDFVTRFYQTGYVLPGDGGAGFAALDPSTNAFLFSSTSYAYSNFVCDPTLGFVGVHHDGLMVAPRDGGTYQPGFSRPFARRPTDALAVGDFTGDGELDTIVVQEWPTNNGPFVAASLLAGHGNGTFGLLESDGGPALLLPDGGYPILADGGFNYDVEGSLLQGLPLYQEPALYNDGRLGAADFNADGVTDLLFQGGVTGSMVPTLQVQLSPGKPVPGPTFTLPLANIKAEGQGVVGRLIDFDLDGRVDVIGLAEFDAPTNTHARLLLFHNGL